MTVSPLGSRYFSNFSSGSLAKAGSAQSAAAKTRTRRSTCVLLPEGTGLLLPTPPRRKLGPHVHGPPATSPSSQAVNAGAPPAFPLDKKRTRRRGDAEVFFHKRFSAPQRLRVVLSSPASRRARCGRRRFRRGSPCGPS